MTDEKEILKKLNDINNRAQEIKQRNKIVQTKENVIDAKNAEEERIGARAGSEFLASVLAGAIIGYGIDWYFNLQPWGMIIFIILGFVSGTYRANTTMQETNKKTEKE